MRYAYTRGVLFVLVVGVLLAHAAAQPPGGPGGTPAGTDPKLESLLRAWEADMGQTQSLVVDFNVTRTYQGGIQKEFVGVMRCMKLADGTFGAFVQQHKKENPRDITEQYLCTGTEVYNISPLEKQVYIHKLPARQQGAVPDDGALPFLFGMRAATARQRYQLRTEEPQNPALKPWYLYVHVLPNFARDQQDFNRARLVIMQGNHPAIPVGMPKEVYWVESNNNTTKWDIQKIQRNVPGLVRAEEFVKPRIPAGWRVENVPAPSEATTRPPTVIRPQGK
jgi:TIGR03009 family protein